MSRVRPHRPSPALVISAIALFVALGGPAAAQDAVSAAAKKITGKRIAANAVTSSKVKNGSLRAKDFKAGEIARAVPKPDAYTRAQADARYQGKGDYLASTGKALDADKLDGRDSADFLGKGDQAADARALGGIGPSGYVRGDGGLHGATRSLPEGATETLLAIPGMPALVAECVDSAGLTGAAVRLGLPTAGMAFDEAYMNDGIDDNDDGRADIEARVPYNSMSSVLRTATGNDEVEVSFNLTRRAATTSITNYRVFMTGVNAANNCRFSVTATTQSFAGLTSGAP